MFLLVSDRFDLKCCEKFTGVLFFVTRMKPSFQANNHKSSRDHHANISTKNIFGYADFTISRSTEQGITAIRWLARIASHFEDDKKRGEVNLSYGSVVGRDDMNSIVSARVRIRVFVGVNMKSFCRVKDRQMEPFVLDEDV